MGEDEDNWILQNSRFYPHYDIIMGQNRVKTFFRVEGAFLDDLSQIWFVSWLGVGEEKDNRILQNSRFYPHYDVIIRKKGVLPPSVG